MGIDATPGTRRECLSTAMIRQLKQVGPQAVPSGFDAAECTRDADAKVGGMTGSAGESGQCRKPDGSVALRYTVGTQAAADNLKFDINLAYDFDNQGETSKATMALHHEGRRVGDCAA